MFVYPIDAQRSFWLLLLLWSFNFMSSSHGQVLVSVDSGVTLQTIQGWEAVAWAAQDTSSAFPHYQTELLDRAVNEVGINRLRLEVRSGAENATDFWTLYQNGEIEYEVWRANRYATVNDNADPHDQNTGGFHFSELEKTVEKIVLPMRDLVQANGEHLYINLNYVAFTAQIARGQYHHDQPEEYAEFMLAAFRHLDDRFGFVPDAIEILLEPDNVSQWDGTLLGRAIVATARRLETAGYRPDFIAPSCTNMGNAVSYFDAMASVPGAIDSLSEIAYHRYGGVSSANLFALADRAQRYHLLTSMLEWWDNANGYQVLHTDLKTGLNSAWQHGVLGGSSEGVNDSMMLFVIDERQPENPIVRLNRKTGFTRLYYRFVRSGAQRIGCTSSHASFDPLAFVNPQGSYTVILQIRQPGDFLIEGLPAGTYHLMQATSSNPNIVLPSITIGEGEPLNGPPIFDVGVVTVVSKSLRLSHPIMDNQSLSLIVDTLVPEARVVIQTSKTLGNEAQWTDVGEITLHGLRAKWSGSIDDSTQQNFYRAVFR